LSITYQPLILPAQKILPCNEELLARMIEILIPGMHIKRLKYEPPEQHGLSVSHKISIFKR